MLRMVATWNRADTAVGNEYNLDGVFDPLKDIVSLVRKNKIPIKKKVGFFMFSKLFYNEHLYLVERIL